MDEIKKPSEQWDSKRKKIITSSKHSVSILN